MTDRLPLPASITEDEFWAFASPADLYRVTGGRLIPADVAGACWTTDGQLYVSIRPVEVEPEALLPEEQDQNRCCRRSRTRTAASA